MRYQHAFVRGAAATLAIVSVAACTGDGSVAPDAGTPSAVRAGRSTTDQKTTDPKTTTFTVQPNRSTTQSLNGGHKIVIPANAICDPATSGYGSATWEAPCTPIATSLTITAVSSFDAAGHPAVQFSPDLRFTPNDAKPVTLYMYDKAAAQDPSFRILYCSAPLNCIDESLTDPEVATKTDLKNGFLYRRIKHFSGYNIVSGYGSGASME